MVDADEVVIPKNFQYTKEPILNKILKANVVSFDYNREINNTILKIVSGIQKGKLSKIKTFYIDKNGQSLLNKERAVVVFDSTMI